MSAADPDVVHLLGTARSVRRFTSEPVPDDAIRELLWCASRAPSPANSQPWHFVVVRDEATKASIGDLIAPALAQRRVKGDELSRGASARMLRDVDLLAEHLADAPALIFCCGDGRAVGGGKRMLWSAMYTSVAFLLVAARSAGLGSILTMFHLLAEPQLRSLLAIPDDIDIAAVVVVGHPAQDFTEVRRRDVDEIVSWEKWQTTSDLGRAIG
jgi:nitroreductase